VEVLNENKHNEGVDGENVSSEEQLIIKGVMESATTNVGEIMTPLTQVYQLQDTEVVSADKRMEMWIKGHSRIPVKQQNGSLR